MGWKRARMKYTCGAAAANTRARARAGAGGRGWSCGEMWMLWNGVLRLPVRFRVTRAERLCGKRREGEL